MNSKLKAAVAVVALAVSGAAAADPIPVEGLFLTLRDSTNVTSLVVNLNLTTTAFRSSPTSPYMLDGDGLADLTAYLSSADLAAVRWNVQGASNGAIGTDLYGGLATSSVDPALGVQDWGTETITNTLNAFVNFRNLTNAGLTGSQGWATSANNAFFSVQVGGTSFVNDQGTIGQSLGFYSFFADQSDPDFTGLSSPFAGNWTLNYLAGVGASLAYTAGVTPPVPVPAAVWLFASGIAGLMGVSRRKKLKVA